MSKIRVYELAKTLGMENKDLLVKLKEKGIDASNSLSMIDDNSDMIKELKPDTDNDLSKKSEKSEAPERDKESLSTKKKFISADEIKKKTGISSQKEREKLSIFYKTSQKEKVSLTPTSPVKPPQQSKPLTRPKPRVKESDPAAGSSSTSYSLIGIAFSLVALIIAISFASKIQLLPQSITSLVQSHERSSNKVTTLKQELSAMRSELHENKKLSLKKELQVIDFLSSKSKGKTKERLKTIGKSLALLLEEMDKDFGTP